MDKEAGIIDNERFIDLWHENIEAVVHNISQLIGLELGVGDLSLDRLYPELGKFLRYLEEFSRVRGDDDNLSLLFLLFCFHDFTC